MEAGKLDGASLRSTYQKIPVVVKSKTVSFKKEMYLCPASMTCGTFMAHVRKHARALTAAEAMYLLVGTHQHIQVPLHESIGSLDKTYAADDGYLYVHVEKEETFGEREPSNYEICLVLLALVILVGLVALVL